MQYLLFIISFSLFILSESVINKHYKNDIQRDMTIHKVSFTQKGYIQFLKYISDVPPLNDYTFCIWVRSNNLTYSHPLLSYSKHEEERLIRVWISPHGTYLNLNIYEIPLFKILVNFKENHWYHICQSWSSNQANWNLFLNGKLKSSGFSEELRDVTIKGGGDIVVGQEYTDFDKGLDDGIEGDVFGFNFVLSTTSHLPLRRHYINRIPLSSSTPAHDISPVLSYFSIETNRKPKNLYYRKRLGNNDINDIKPNGLKLVELGYRCYIGRGAPITGRDVLISWTQTPVRVFGGAILKNIQPFCM